MFEPKTPKMDEGLKPLEEILEEGGEPVLLTVYDMPMDWAWELLPPVINVQVTLDVRKKDDEEEAQ